MQILIGLTGLPMRIAFSPDGRYLGAGETNAFRLWDLSVGSSPVWSRPQFNDHLRENFAFAPDSASVIGGRADSFARYDIHSGAKTPDSLLKELQPIAFSPDGQFGVAIDHKRDFHSLGLTCAVVGSGGCVEVWRKVFSYNPFHDHAAYRLLIFSSDGHRFVRVAGRGKRNANNVRPSVVEVFDSASGERLAEWVGDLPYYAQDGAVSPTGAVALLNARALYAINTAVPNSAPVKRVNASPKPLEAAAFTRDGSRLAVVGRDTAATIWDATTWEVRKRYEWNIGRLRAVCFSPDGLRCAAAGDTGQVVVWDLDD